MSALDGVAADCIEHLQAGYQLAAGEYADLEFAAGERGHACAQGLCSRVEDVQAPGEARRQPPADDRQLRRFGGRGLRVGQRQQGRAGTRQKVSSLHESPPILADYTSRRETAAC